MNKQDLLFLYKYNQWTTDKILNSVTGLTQEQFLAPASFPYGGLQGTLVHIVSAYWTWRSRWEGVFPTTRLDPKDFPTFESVVARWTEEDKLLGVFLNNVNDEKLNATFKYTNISGKPFEKVLWQTIFHLFNHNMQHKTEAAAMLTDLGRSPGDIDFVYFLDEL